MRISEENRDRFEEGKGEKNMQNIAENVSE